MSKRHRATKLEKLERKAKRALRKLKTRQSTKQQRDSWKHILAKKFRAFPTTEEHLMAEELGKFGFKNQVLIAGYVVDFCDGKTVVEIDGFYHRTNDGIVRDKLRDEVLRQRGYRIVRIPNSLVRKSLTDAVALAVNL